jgi:hypothetical protein
LTLATASVPSLAFAPAAAIASAAAAEQQAARITSALIARLRIGRIDLQASVACERASSLALA